MIFDWPANLVPKDISVRPPRATAGFSRSLTNTTQVVPVIRPPFAMTLVFDTLFGDDLIAYRAAIASFEGRANKARVPLFDLKYRATDAQIGAGAVTHSDGTSFSDGALYLTDDLDGVTVTGVQGQRTITADFGSYGELLQGGLYFGLGDHPYIASAVWWDGSVATIRCNRTLITDYDAEPLRLKPTMLCRLPDDNAGEHAMRQLYAAQPSLDLVEDFDEVLS